MGRLRIRARVTRAQGFTYLGLLFFVLLMGIALAQVAQVWHTMAQREKEAELLFIGAQFRSAIERYYTASPGAAQYPKVLEDLLEDKRFPNVRRYLRRIYIDPMTSRQEWGLTRIEGVGIVGVHSLSTGAPLKQDNFAAADASFAGAKSYQDWVFTVRAAIAQPAQPAVPAPAGTVAIQPVPLSPVTPPAAPAADTAQPPCEQLRLTDMSQCSAMRERGALVAAARCTLSASQRATACRSGEAMPPLSTSGG